MIVLCDHMIFIIFYKGIQIKTGSVYKYLAQTYHVRPVCGGKSAIVRTERVPEDCGKYAFSNSSNVPCYGDCSYVLWVRHLGHEPEVKLVTLFDIYICVTKAVVCVILSLGWCI